MSIFKVSLTPHFVMVFSVVSIIIWANVLILAPSLICLLKIYQGAFVIILMVLFISLWIFFFVFMFAMVDSLLVCVSFGMY